MPACETEIDFQQRDKTWVLVPRNGARSVIGSLWVFRKEDVNNENRIYGMQHRARLVVKCFLQIHGVDTEEASASVVSFTKIRTVLALFTHLDLECRQMIVKTAFLKGYLLEEVYMEQAEGFVNLKFPNYVYKLKKCYTDSNKHSDNGSLILMR